MIKHSKNSRNLTLREIQYFFFFLFLRKYFLNCCKSLVNFQSSEKLILTILGTFLIIFMENSISVEVFWVTFHDSKFSVHINYVLLYSWHHWK